MKIIKFLEYIKENVHDTPQQYISVALDRLKSKMEAIFKTSDDNDDNIQTIDAHTSKNKKKRGDMSIGDLGITLDDITISKYSKLDDSIKVIFSDDQYRYDLLIVIDLKQAMPAEGDEDKDFKVEDIKKCFVKFKKYNTADKFNLVGETSKNVNINDINEDFLVNLKIELDKNSGEDEELGMDYETEDGSKDEKKNDNTSTDTNNVVGKKNR